MTITAPAPVRQGATGPDAPPVRETATRRWFAAQAAREARIVVLEEALLGGRFGRYTWYRLRWFLLTYLVESAAHAVMAVTLFATLGGDVLVLVAVHAATLLVSHGWWGVLEVLRARVRDLHRAARPHRIPAEIAGWVTAGLLLGAAVAVAAVGVAGWSLAVDGGVTGAYVAATLLRLALDIPTRAVHSGVYAMRRVYKPVAAALAPQLVGLALLLALVPALGPAALVVSSLVTTGLVTWLTLRYTGRIYRFLGIRVRRELGWRALRPALRGSARGATAGALANSAIGLDALVVLALLAGSTRAPEALFVLFLTMPTIAAGAEWARLLYFDLKRLELRLFSNLRRRFEQATEWLALGLGLGFGVLAAVITAAATGRVDPAAGAALMLFFVARSALARAQITAFAAGSYTAVAVTGVGCVTGFVAVGVLSVDEAARLGGMAAVTAVTTLLLGRFNAARTATPPPAALLTMEWLRLLGEVRAPLRVGVARLAGAPGPDRLDARAREDADRWRLARLADRVAGRLGRTGAAAWIGPDRVVWLERADPSRPHAPGRVTPAWLQQASGGLVRQVRTVHCPDGEQALLHTARTDLLGRPSTALRTAVVPVDVAAARRRFTTLVPDGLVYAPGEPPPAALLDLPGPQLRAILSDATTFARDLVVHRRRSGFEVTPLCAGGELQLVFIAARGSGRRSRGRWTREVRALNLRAAVAGVRPTTGGVR